jgi:hypothetical protein
MKSIILWDMPPCSLLSCNRRFGGTCRLHLQGRRNNLFKNQQAFCLPPACLLVLAELFLWPWSWRRYVPPKRRLQLNRLHGGISQKMILFITIAVKTSNPTNFVAVRIFDSSASWVVNRRIPANVGNRTISYWMWTGWMGHLPWGLGMRPDHETSCTLRENARTLEPVTPTVASFCKLVVTHYN